MIIQSKQESVRDAEIDEKVIDERIAWLQFKRTLVGSITSTVRTTVRVTTMSLFVLLLATLFLVGVFHVQYILYKFNRCYEVSGDLRSCTKL